MNPLLHDGQDVEVGLVHVVLLDVVDVSGVGLADVATDFAQVGSDTREGEVLRVLANGHSVAGN